MNRRRILAGMGGWKNPYVTEDMISMHDGEWNAGGGIHRDRITEWIPCVGNNVYRKGASATGTISAFSNYLRSDMTGGTGYLLSGSESIPYTTQGWTIENTCRIVQLRKGVTICCGYWGGGGVYLSRYLTYWHTNYGSMAFKTDIDTSVAHTYSFVATNSQLKGYLDGVYIGVKNFIFANGSSTVGIQGQSNRGVLNSHCLRLYNRALTAAEIAANYAIDKARFGLT